MQIFIEWVGYIGVGVLVGTLSGLLGVGGGIIMVPLIVLIWRQDMKVAIGTSLATMIPTAFAGSIRHLGLGNVNLALAGCLSVGAVLGTVFIGAPLANYLPSEVLKRIFGILMVVSGLQWSGIFDLFAKLFSHGPGG